MRKYSVVDVSEKQLEEMIRQSPESIEDGLRYIDHQKRTERGPLDVLFADSGNALIVAELKVTEADGMLVQGIDYYDYMASNIEGFARAYKHEKIDPRQRPRLFLISPSFSISLLNRCKWIDIPISLFIFRSIMLENDTKDIMPVFNEIIVPSKNPIVELYTIEERLDYITNTGVRKTVEELLKEIQSWDKDRILIEPLKYEISIKVSGRVFSYIGPRRRHFTISTYDNEDKWTSFPIHQAGDLEGAKILMKNSYEKFR